MPGPAAHGCPVRDCAAPVGARMLMCRPHWYAVPAPLRRAVYDAWRGGLGAGSAAHRAAILAAVRSVSAKLPPGR